MPYGVRNQQAWVTTGDPASVNDATLYAPGMLGITITIKEPGPLGAPASSNPTSTTQTSPAGDQFRYGEWQLVRVDSSSVTSVTPFPGAVAMWLDKANYIVTTNPAPSTLASGTLRNSPAGTFQGFPALGNFTYIKRGGPGRVKFIDGVTQANAIKGAFVIASATAGKADVVAAGTASTYTPLGTMAGSINAVDLTGIVDHDIIPVTP